MLQQSTMMRCDVLDDDYEFWRVKNVCEREKWWKLLKKIETHWISLWASEPNQRLAFHCRQFWIIFVLDKKKMWHVEEYVVSTCVLDCFICTYKENLKINWSEIFFSHVFTEHWTLELMNLSWTYFADGCLTQLERIWAK